MSKAIVDKGAWKAQQELHVESQRHAEWVAKQILRRLRDLQEVFGYGEGTEHFVYLMPKFEKKYAIKGDHWKYARALVLKQIAADGRS